MSTDQQAAAAHQSSAAVPPGERMLEGVRVLELADEQAEYIGMVLAGLGAEVTKVEPTGGEATRSIGPFYEDERDPERSLFFWQYNRGKRSIVLNLKSADGKDVDILRSLLARADVLIDSTTGGNLADLGFDRAAIGEQFPALIVARVTPFGDSGPWAEYRGSDLVHLALGGQTMNCGYDPRPDGSYDLPPIAPQMWHAYHVAGENMVMAILAALFERRTSGRGEYLSGAVHESVAKNTEIDLMSWVMRRAPVFRQTCRHAGEKVSIVPTIQQTKDGRWFMVVPAGSTGGPALVDFLGRYRMAGDLTASADDSGKLGRAIPGTAAGDETGAHTAEVVQRLVRKFTFDDFPWRDAQDHAVMCVPLRRPEENIDDEHWKRRGTYSQIEHPEHGRSFSYVTSKWISSETAWVAGRRAPLIDEDREAILAEIRDRPKRPTPSAGDDGAAGRFPLEGVRVLDFGWFLASAGGTRFLAAMGAECLKVEWAAHPDTRIGAMAPVGGRAARERATSVLPPVDDPDMGGQFNNKNPGKRGISLNVRHPRGLEIARELVGMSDIVSEGFSPGVLDKWGLGYEQLREIKPDIIYAQQSGMGSHGRYGRFRAIGPIAASLSGLSEMSGLPEPAMPAGWGYSYLDWIGAYSFGIAMLGALNYRARTGRGQWIDASQTESGLFIGGTSVLDWSANGRGYQRTANRSPYKVAAPHGIYPCRGEDHWIAIASFGDADWQALASVAGHSDWLSDARFRTLESRLENQDQLDRAVAGWTASQDRYELMFLLQEAGVAAGVCQTAEDRVERDPQLSSLEWLVELPGTKIGTWPVADVSVKPTRTRARSGGVLERGAPIYGEDNEYVYGDLLGLSTREIGRLTEQGVI